ncbi:4Fe-4S dicluster domain-containing protein [Desulfobacterales bacterium HSG16]|nr:4Fe-4S dicluster domain-containing protein [Desulfobacterales bacterium HSG16]
MKKLRMAVAVLIFALFLLTFLGHGKIAELLSAPLLFFQFVPSLLHFTLKPGDIAGSGFLFVCIGTLLFGRFYCSFLCPSGILQDMFIAISRKTGLKKTHVFQKPYPLVRYSLLLLTLFSALLGTLAFVNLLDPYSLFGRIAADVFKWGSTFTNNILVDILESFDIYALSMKEQHFTPVAVLAVSMISLCFIVALSMFFGRLYCNTICPVGAFLGIFSRFSFFKFSIDRKKCSTCGLCEKSCKAGCIAPETLDIDLTRCVVCFNCLNVCKKSAVKYVFDAPFITGGQWALSRRKFLIGSAVAGGSLLSVESPVRFSINDILSEKKVPITPPGSFGIVHFTKTCTACHLCVSACQTNVITPAFLEYGVSGLLQPRMNYMKGHCDFECNTCGYVCPTGAISPVLLKDKKQIQIGKASLDRKQCIVHVKKRHCGACGEACPTHAIIPAEKGLVLFPEMKPEYCIGCGACERACPTKPKAITVTASQIHAKAEKYIPSPLPVVDYKNEDFPF